jgi:hypothetical protein
MIRALASLLAGTLALTACGAGEERVTFDGLAFRASAAPVDRRADRSEFDVRVRNATQSLDGAREAGRFEGTKYCINNYGTSRIEWTVGPDTEASRLVLSNGDLALRGRCTP